MKIYTTPTSTQSVMPGDRKPPELLLVKQRRGACSTILDFLQAARRGLPEKGPFGFAGDELREPIGATILVSAESHLTSDRDAFLQVARACDMEQAVRTGLILKRDEAVAVLGDGYAGFRRFVDGAYGLDASRRLGFPARMPRNTRPMCRVLTRVATNIEDPLFLRSHPVPGWIQVDPKLRVRHLRSLVRGVEESLEELIRSRHRLKICRTVRDEAKVTLDTSIRFATQLLLAFFTYAGMKEEVKLLKAALRRK